LRFFLPRSAQVSRAAKKLSGRSRKGETHLAFRKRKRLVRNIITVAIFVVMFSMFGLFLMHVSEDHPPQPQPQPIDQ
jgi:flagellar basal body-associated protein FliL